MPDDKTNGNGNGANGSFKITPKNIAIVAVVCGVILSIYMCFEAKFNNKADKSDFIAYLAKQEKANSDQTEFNKDLLVRLIKIETLLENKIGK